MALFRISFSSDIFVTLSLMTTNKNWFVFKVVLLFMCLLGSYVGVVSGFCLSVAFTYACPLKEIKT